MSVQGRKRLEGESGVRDWFNKWFPYHSQGLGATIMTTGGINDIGDIDGVPFTMVEVKNYKKPVLGPLVRNAEWKAANANRDFWVLVVKRNGYSRVRAGNWYAVTTVSGMKNFNIIDSENIGFAELVSQGGSHVVSIPERHYSTLWATPDTSAVNMNLVVNSGYNGVLDKTNNVDDNSLLTLNVFPRRKHLVDGWFVVTSLDQYCQILELAGILPPQIVPKC